MKKSPRDTPKAHAHHCHDEDVHLDQLLAHGIGQTFYLNNRLICRASGSIIIFRRLLYHADDEDYDDSKFGEYYWKKLHSIQFEDQCAISKADRRNEFIITTSQFIYLYSIQNNVEKPKLIYVLNNFLGCDMMVTGPKNVFNITYNHSQPDFFICYRNSNHDFKVNVNNQPKEDSCCINLKDIKGMYCVSEYNQLVVYN